MNNAQGMRTWRRFNAGLLRRSIAADVPLPFLPCRARDRVPYSTAEDAGTTLPQSDEREEWPCVIA